jgi:hypothetical protein
MKASKGRTALIGSVCLAVIMACTVPVLESPTPFLFPTPDLTLTAIFFSLDTPVPPSIQTATLPVPVPSDTPAAFLPTNTPLSSPTETQPASVNPSPTAGLLLRAGATVEAVFLDTPLTVDANLSDWQLTPFAADRVVYGAGQRSGSADLSAVFGLGWDNLHLYLWARILDDVYVQTETGINIFRGDSLEILVDADLQGDFHIDRLNGDDYQLGISPGRNNPGEDPEAYLWYPTSKAGPSPNVLIAAQKTSDGYLVEAAIPWSVFGITPQEGQIYGFGFSVSDNDLAGESVQQSMVSNISTRQLSNPTTWGNLVLTQAR